MTQSLEQAIGNRSAKLGVIGLGYVGLPLIRAFIQAGFHTLGFDIDQTKVDKLKAGQSYIKHIPAEWIAKTVAERHVRAHGRHAAAGRSRRDADLRAHAAEREPRSRLDLHRRNREADRRDLAAGPIGRVGKHDLSRHDARRRPADPRRRRTCRSARIISWPSAPSAKIRAIAKYSAESIPKVVGGIDPESGRLAALLYSQAIVQVVPVSNCEIAEAARSSKTPTAR